MDFASVNQEKQEVPPIEPHYTVREIATALKLDEDTVRRLFQDMPGVFVYRRKRLLGKRQYSTLRIPASVFERFYRDRTGGFPAELKARRRAV